MHAAATTYQFRFARLTDDINPQSITFPLAYVRSNLDETSSSDGNTISTMVSIFAKWKKRRVIGGSNLVIDCFANSSRATSCVSIYCCGMVELGGWIISALLNTYIFKKICNSTILTTHASPLSLPSGEDI